MAEQWCSGQTSLGPCEHEARYVVFDNLTERNGYYACRLHLPQLVKHVLDSGKSVIVHELRATKG